MISNRSPRPPSGSWCPRSMVIVFGSVCRSTGRGMGSGSFLGVNAGRGTAPAAATLPAEPPEEELSSQVGGSAPRNSSARRWPAWSPGSTNAHPRQEPRQSVADKCHYVQLSHPALVQLTVVLQVNPGWNRWIYRDHELQPERTRYRINANEARVNQHL